ncbi:MAG: biotin/lipoyl-binding protein, partial [Cyanobacteria bacterium SZAS LIN-2]|nr:biotin/lipoyl-binding protein [Cyanobacteria bacterium SZAS LIN-2]
MAVSTDSYKETEDFKNTAVQGQSGPIPPVPSAADPAERRPSFKRLATGLLIVGLLVGAIAGGFSYYGWATTHEQTDDAYVDGHSSAVSSRVSGTVARVFIDDNQIVKKGDLLATLDPTDYQIKVDQAQAAVDLARKQLDQSNAAVRQYATTAAAQSTSAQGDIVSAQAMINMANSNVSQAQSAVVQQQHAIQSLKA